MKTGMKLIVNIIISIAVVACIYSVAKACLNGEVDTEPISNVSSVSDIKEEVTLERIVNNPERYKNQRVEIEGVYNCMDDNGIVHYMSEGYCPGCVGSDDNTLELTEFDYFSKGIEVDDTIRVFGVVESQMIEGYEYPILRVENVELVSKFMY